MRLKLSKYNITAPNQEHARVERYDGMVPTTYDNMMIIK